MVNERSENMPIGSYQHNIDVKGRVFMPAKFREELGDKFVMCRGTVRCIFVFSKDGWNEFTSNIVNIPTTDMKLQTFIRRLYASASEADTDKQGRILLPQKLRDYAGLEKEAVVNGVQNRVEIWNPDEWDNYLDGTDDDFDEIFAKLAELGI